MCLFTHRLRDFSRTVIVKACCCQSDETLKAISNCAGVLEKVGYRIVAIACVNTCKR